MQRELSSQGGVQREPLHPQLNFFSSLIGRSRYVVLLAVAGVLLVSLSLFLLGTITALISVWNAWASLASGTINTADLTVNSLELVSLMLKAVIFYLIGLGFYSLFITPLNLAISLGVETLSDLESKIASVVVVILGVTFLEHFVHWEEPVAMLQFGLAAGLVSAALILFQFYNHRVKEDMKDDKAQVQMKAQHKLFVEEKETQVIEDQAGDTRRTPQDSE